MKPTWKAPGSKHSKLKHDEPTSICAFKINLRRFTEGTCHSAAAGGHLAVLKWAREHGCPWNSGTCAAAAQGGHLDVLKWAREHGCEWSMSTCAAAAQGGQLETLQWLRQHGCEWNSGTCAAGAYTRSLFSST
jgi:hypothetical protein